MFFKYFAEAWTTLLFTSRWRNLVKDNRGEIELNFSRACK